MNTKREPLNVEMIPSVFNIPRYKNGTIEYFMGADAEVVKVLDIFFNVSVMLELDDPIAFNQAELNLTSILSYQRLLQNVTHLIATGIYIRHYGHTEDVDFTVPIYWDRICCVVPKANRIPHPILPLIIFTPTTWLSLFISIALCAIVWNILRKWEQPQDYTSVLKWCEWAMYFYVNIWIIYLSAPLTHRPSSCSERIFVTFIFLVSLIVLAYYMSYLSTVFVAPIYYKDINTINQLIESNLVIKLNHRTHIDPLFSEQSPLSQKIEYIDTNVPILGLIANHSVIAAAAPLVASLRLSYLSYFINKELNEMDECPRSYNMAFAMRKDSPLLPKLNAILSNLLYGGFIDKWINDMYFNATMGNLKVFREQSYGEFKILSISDMDFHFYILSIGFMSSALVLCAEFVYFHVLSHRKNLIKLYKK